MLYQTVPSFHPFRINPPHIFFSPPLLQLFSPSHNLFFSLSLTLLLLLSSLYLSQVEKKVMECVEAKALKTSFRPEMSLKSNQQQQQVVFEDIITSVPLVGVGDETFVDDFLDFSNEDVENEQGFAVEDEEKEDGLSQKQDNTHYSSSNGGASGKNDVGSVFGSELSVPTDDLADLEWLSHFVEDSFSEFSLQHLPGNPSEKPGTLSTKKKRSEPETGGGTETPLSQQKPVDFPIPIPAKARSKRSRAVRVWSIAGSSSLTENSSSSSTTSTSSSSSCCLIFNNSGSQNLECFEYFEKHPPMKKQRKKKQGMTSGGNPLQIRRCSHCGVQKTPQWRAGPNGAKTLCNACGVRFKSGRLLPEYRPACSPTFSSEVHSNNHRKVLEMRKKKEVGPPASGFAPAVHSF